MEPVITYKHEGKIITAANASSDERRLIKLYSAPSYYIISGMEEAYQRAVLGFPKTRRGRESDKHPFPCTHAVMHSRIPRYGHLYSI